MRKNLQRAARQGTMESYRGCFDEPTREAYHIQATERQDEPA